MSDGNGVGFALLSFLFAGLNDLVFKRYALAARSRGMLVMGIGVVWTALQLLLFAILERPLRFSPTTLGFGGAAGLLLVSSNLLLVESLGHVELSLGSTIYRLNTVAVAALSVALLGERLGPSKLAGIVLGVLAVLLLSRRPGWHPRQRAYPWFVAAVVAAALLRATYGVVTRAAMLAHVPPEPMLLLVSSSWIAGGALYAIARDRGLRVTRETVGYSALSGALVFLIVYFLLRAVEHGEASVVIPIANMSFLVALSASLATKMEPLTTRKLLAACLAVAAILLLARG